MRAAKFYFLLMMLSITLYSFSQSLPTRKINFDNNWKFALAVQIILQKILITVLQLFFQNQVMHRAHLLIYVFMIASWRKLNLPHDWVVELPFVNSTSDDVESHGYKPVGGLFPETSIGWYRKHFIIPASDSGHRFQIQFDGIFRDATIWVNGFFVGNNKSGYVGCAYDITDFINFHKENIITVRVDATQYEGWFYEGAGIYRHVWLNQYNNTHIATDGVFVYHDVKENNATVNIQSTIRKSK